MTNDGYRFALHFFRPDGTAIGQVALDEPLSIDWVPVEEWLRFSAVRRLGAPPHSGPLAIDPVWHRELGGGIL